MAEPLVGNHRAARPRPALSRGRSARRRTIAVGIAAAASAGAVLAATAAGAGPLPASAHTGASPAVATGSTAAAFQYRRAWEHSVPNAIVQSSPIPIKIGSTKSFVVGSVSSRTGHGGAVYAFSLDAGRLLTGWPVTTPHGGVDSTPSVNGNLVYVGVDDGSNGTGGYMAISAKAHRQAWYATVPPAPGRASSTGVQASMAVGDLNGKESVVAGSLGQYDDELRASNGATRPGWPWLSSDTEFSTPAIANLYGNGRNYIISGAEQTGNAAVHEAKGGHLWVLDANGTAGTGTGSPLQRGAACQYAPNQGVMSSPAVGRFLQHNQVGIVVGTGYDFRPLPSDSDDVFALGTHCGLAWKTDLGSVTLGSPALVDALGNGHLQVVEATAGGYFTGSSQGGTVYLLDGANGGVYWKHRVGAPVLGSVVSANLGGGHQDILVPTINGLYILNGKTGRQIAILGHGIALQNAPLVTDNANGTIGITIAGSELGHGEIEHFAIGRTDGKLADEAGAWPMFHHDPELTGTTLARIR